VLVYCASGGRSAKAAKALAAMGYTSVHDLSGGIRRWQSEGRPVEK
jgi:rhodanese-related sulfurtransferase